MHVSVTVERRNDCDVSHYSCNFRFSIAAIMLVMFRTKYSSSLFVAVYIRSRSPSLRCDVSIQTSVASARSTLLQLLSLLLFTASTSKCIIS